MFGDDVAIEEDSKQSSDMEVNIRIQTFQTRATTAPGGDEVASVG